MLPKVCVPGLSCVRQIWGGWGEESSEIEL